MAVPEEDAQPLRLCPEERRQDPRIPVLWSAQLDIGELSFPCVVLNISAGGALLQLIGELPKRPAVLIIEHHGQLLAEIVWQFSEKTGIRFTEEPQHIAAILGETLHRPG